MNSRNINIVKSPYWYVPELLLFCGGRVTKKPFSNQFFLHRSPRPPTPTLKVTIICKRSEVNICLATVSCDHVLRSLAWQYFALMKIGSYGLPHRVCFSMCCCIYNSHRTICNKGLLLSEQLPDLYHISMFY